MIHFISVYGTSTTSFYDTNEFQSKYLKYVERVAMYVDYRERGFTGTVNYEDYITDWDAIFIQTTIPTENQNFSREQSDFDYYNTILNGTNKNFLYYVKNLDTGVIYYSPNYESLLTNTDEEKKNNELSTLLDNYNKNIQTNDAYLIINTGTRNYSTNVNRGNEYLNDENLQWVMDYVNGSIYSLDSSSTGGDYLICTSILKDFPNTTDEFGTMYATYDKLHNNYKQYLSYLPFLFLLVLLFLSFVLVFTGHKKNSAQIHLQSFDRWYTELGILCLFVVGTINAYLIYNPLVMFLEQNWHPSEIHILLLFFTCFYPILNLGTISTIRRIKSGTILKNSIIYQFVVWLFHFIRDYFLQKKLTFHVTWILLCFVILQGLGIYALKEHNNQIFIVMFFISYCFLGIFVLKVTIDYNILSTETKKIAEGDLNHKVPIKGMCIPPKTLGNYINNIGDGLSIAVDEKLKSERLKTELIANVSHDIKTPLTSIINYVDLLKKETMENETAKGYLEILSSKSWRLKNLIEDLVEASKASSGAITLNLEQLDIVELLRQSIGEFEDRLMEHKLEAVLNIRENMVFPQETANKENLNKEKELMVYSKEAPVYILADGRSTYRMIENLLSNAYKYALPGTRIYVDMESYDTNVTISIKNISTNKLNIRGDELMERFVRGDLSRNTEGSGLGLSITKSLASLQNASFDILLDGDVFKAQIIFPRL